MRNHHTSDCVSLRCTKNASVAQLLVCYVIVSKSRSEVTTEKRGKTGGDDNAVCAINTIFIVKIIIIIITVVIVTIIIASEIILT
jgi:hypothetical protein